AREVRWRCQSGLGAEPRSDTKSETGDAPFCNWDNTAAACATAPRCSKSTTSLQGFSATEPASDQGAPQKCSLPENDAGYAPNPNRAGESSNTYSPSPTTSNFEIGSSEKACDVILEDAERVATPCAEPAPALTQGSAAEPERVIA